MHGHLATLDRLVRLVIAAAKDERITFLAASIAFYAVLSIFPLLLLVLVVGSMLGGELFAEVILEAASELLAPQAASLVEEALGPGAGRGGAGLVGLVFLLWSALKVFRGLDIAFSEIYVAGAQPTFLSSVLHALFVLLAVGAGFTAMFVIGAAVRLLPLSSLVGTLSPVLIFLTIAVLFFPVYVVFPGVKQPLPSVVPGTLFAAAGWTLLASLFGLYAANAGTFALFGVIGGLLLTLMWFYFGSILILLGAVINAVIAGRYRVPGEDEVGSGPILPGEERPIGEGPDDQSERDE